MRPTSFTWQVITTPCSAGVRGLPIGSEHACNCRMFTHKLLHQGIRQGSNDRLADVIVRARTDRPMHCSLPNRPPRPNGDGAAPATWFSAPRTWLVVIGIEELDYAGSIAVLRIGTGCAHAR